MTIPEVCVVYLTRRRAGAREVLLGRKRTGLGVGKVVAPGGKLELGETPRQAAVREVLEEVGIAIVADELSLIGELQYSFPFKPAWTQKSWAFVVEGPFGDPVPSAELHAEWVRVEHVPVAEMWDDAQYWLLDALGGVAVRATFSFGPDLSTVEFSDHPAFLGSDRKR